MEIIVLKRFTPAHAGNTVFLPDQSTTHQVHPRSRGEYNLLSQIGYKAGGSPPLTRGIHFLKLTKKTSVRFTPAHAGNTSTLHTIFPCCQVHPRSRGEYACQASEKAGYSGSPPLTRGIQAGVWLHRYRVGFTPAHAGNTWLVRKERKQ